MKRDAGFMVSLMDIPFFKELAERNSEEWLESLFEILETESYNFSQFDHGALENASLSIDDAIELDRADLGVDTANTTVVEPAEKKTLINNKLYAEPSYAEKLPSALTPSNGIEKVSHADSVEKAGSSSNVRFDNVPIRPFYLTTYIQLGPGVYLNPQNNWEIVRFEWAGEENWAAESDEVAIVGLTGEYNKLKLSNLADRIYTATGSGETTVQAGEGSDTLYLSTAGLKANLGGTSDFGNNGGKVELRSVENVVGSDGNDTIAGNGEANKLSGRGGNDKIDGGGGDDTITGGAGDNNLSGGTGNDTITGGNSDDMIDGGDGTDTIKSGNGDDDISGGTGTDTIDAGSGDDTITAGAGDDDITGGEGNDTIKADAGKDTVDGGAGNDTVNGGDDDDKITGADGDDTLNGDAGNDTVEGGKGVDTIHGNDGNDTVKGDDGADKLFGDAGNDTIDGGADADDINGGDGDDTLLGGAGKDKIDGGPGADKITGGAGADTIMGGTGADTYIYLAKDDSGTAADTFDIISDFDATTDKFDLTALLANDTFDFVAAEGGAFTGTGPEVRWDKDGTKTFVEIDIDGNGTADMKIELDDAVDLTMTNFNL